MHATPAGKAHLDARRAGKPLLRGVFHEVAAAVSLGAGLLLVGSAGAHGRAPAAIYALTLLMLFLVSAVYHRPTWTPRARLAMRRLDHSAIYLLIAGTYTPFCLVVGGAAGRNLLAISWIGATLGVAKSIAWPRAPRALSTIIYVALGWVVVPCLPALRAALGTQALALLGAGGLLYTLGAVVYATRRPDPFPRVLGYHEVFHALVVAAAALHFAVVAQAVRVLG